MCIKTPHKERIQYLATHITGFTTTQESSEEIKNNAY